MNRPVFGLLLVLAIPGLQAKDTLIETKFDALPDSKDWVTQGAAVQSGNLVLETTGDGDGYTNTIIRPIEPWEKLNFFKKKLTFTLDSIAIEGTAPESARVFVLMLTAGKGSEPDAASYLSLVFNGDGTVVLTIPNGKNESGTANLDKTIFKFQAKLPLKSAELILDKTGYSLEVKDAATTHKEAGKWDMQLDESAWKEQEPMLILKGVCRPATGTVRATVSGLTIEAN